MKEDETWLMFLTFSAWFKEASFEGNSGRVC